MKTIEKFKASIRSKIGIPFLGHSNRLTSLLLRCLRLSKRVNPQPTDLRSINPKTLINSKASISTKWSIKAHLFFSCLAFVILLFYALSLKKNIESVNKHRSVYARFFDTFKSGQLDQNNPQRKRSLANIVFPEKLNSLPFAESSDLVLTTKKISIRNMPACYNASIIKYGPGYLIFFRYDIKDKNIKDQDMYFSYIGCAELDSNFDQTSKEFTTINTGNNHSEDPRVFSVGKKTYLAYITSNFTKETFFSTVNISQIDLETRKLKFATALEMNLSITEKNWTPFEYIDSEGQPHFYLQYSLNPHKILQLPDPQINHLVHHIFPKTDVFQTIHWENKSSGWGDLRGGTPALNIGDEYLAFFHTCFRDKNGSSWYTMGAYTFEKQAPFRITAISQYPILFDGIYDTACLNGAKTNRLVIFPLNFVVEEEKGKEVIHLSCGENDSAIKIITLDKTNLLKSLKKI